MLVELIIDTREKYLIEKLHNYAFKIEQLDIGDIIFKQNNETLFIIERKTINDLKASICDGRHREQKSRLISNLSPDRILYLIEGDLNLSLDHHINGMPVSTLISSLINTQFRDGIKVYKTTSIDESISFIKKLHDKLIKEGALFFKPSIPITESQYVSTLKLKKKENMNSNVWFIALLSLIPQVSEKIGNEIVKKYSTLPILMSEYEKVQLNDRPKLLMTITYPIKNDKIRKIGIKISSRIYQFFYGIEHKS